MSRRNIRTSSIMCWRADEDALPPRALHPIFFGSFDWHSCVHGWWTLLTLRRLFPDTDRGARDRRRSPTSSFTAEKVGGRAGLSRPRPLSRGFERPYGWAWLLQLHVEASRHADRAGRARWSRLPRAFAERLRDYLRVLTYPIRVGTHFNTPFALVLALEWAEQYDQPLAEADLRQGARLVRQRPRLPGLGAGRRRVPLAGADRGPVMARGPGRAGVPRLVRRLPAASWSTASRRACSRPAFVSDRSATARSPISTGSTSAVPGAGEASLPCFRATRPSSPMTRLKCISRRRCRMSPATIWASIGSRPSLCSLYCPSGT